MILPKDKTIMAKARRGRAEYISVWERILEQHGIPTLLLLALAWGAWTVGRNLVNAHIEFLSQQTQQMKLQTGILTTIAESNKIQEKKLSEITDSSKLRDHLLEEIGRALQNKKDCNYDH